jgi:flagellar basal body P-ring formation protein FlgA
MRTVLTMTRTLIAAFVVALSSWALPADPAAAQNAMPALRASVIVTSNLVRIGDLVENAGPVADVPIFRAPDLGTRGAVATERIVEAIRPYHLIGIDTRGLSEVIVTRPSRAITLKEMSPRVAQALEGQYGLGEARNILVEFDHGAHTLNVEPNANGELQILALTYDARTTRFDVTFDLPSSAALRQQSTRFTGIAYETVDNVTVDHQIERGEVLKLSDLIVQRRPKSEGPAIADIHAAAGLAARHALRPGQPLREADLMKPAIVQRNETVTIVYEAPGLTLTLRGQAQDSGALGDTVNVLNVESKRLVQGVVSGPARVTVSAKPTRFVANASEPTLAPPPPPSDKSQHGHSVE